MALKLWSGSSRYVVSQWSAYYVGTGLCSWQAALLIGPFLYTAVAGRCIKQYAFVLHLNGLSLVVEVLCLQLSKVNPLTYCSQVFAEDVSVIVGGGLSPFEYLLGLFSLDNTLRMVAYIRYPLLAKEPGYDWFKWIVLFISVDFCLPPAQQVLMNSSVVLAVAKVPPWFISVRRFTINHHPVSKIIIFKNLKVIFPFVI